MKLASNPLNGEFFKQKDPSTKEEAELQLRDQADVPLGVVARVVVLFTSNEGLESYPDRSRPFCQRDISEIIYQLKSGGLR